MEQGWQTLELDDRTFTVRQLAAPDGVWLAVALPGAGTLHLRPWTLADHLAALDLYAFHDGERPRIDHDGLAAAVLASTCAEPLDARLVAELAPVALWWALGGDQDPEPAPAVRPWTCLARARAIDECTDPDTGALRFGSYLRAMAWAASDGDTDALSGATAATYLDALVEAHAPAPDMHEGPGSTALARATLRVCRGLGWTPGQVWSLPAAELDHLLAMLAHLDDAPRVRPTPQVRRSGLGAYPDAVIIEVNDP